MLDRLLILVHFLRHRFGPRFRNRRRLESWQQKRLRRHLRYVTARSQFYRERLGRGWAAMATVDKIEMMANFDRLNTRGLAKTEATDVALRAELSRDFAPMIGDVTIGLSSGTSGHRGLFCADRSERRRYAGVILAKALPRGGLFGKQRVAFFLRANSNLYESTRSRRLEFGYFDLLEAFDEQLPRLGDFAPTILIAPPSLLREAGRAVLDGRWSPMHLTRVFSVAEVLDPAEEIYLERAFGQKIHQIYQCTEGFLGITCAHGSLHLNEDLVIVEKDWIDERARKFAPVITDLYRRTQPIVRYRLNDILTEDPRPCPCGSVMTRLAMIEGRQDDMIDFPTREGWRAVFPDFVRNAVLYASADIEEYTVCQHPDRHLEVSLRVRGDRADAERKVRDSFASLAERLGCAAPAIDFKPAPARGPAVKLRRIMRRRADAHPPSRVFVDPARPIADRGWKTETSPVPRG